MSKQTKSHNLDNSLIESYIFIKIKLYNLPCKVE